MAWKTGRSGNHLIDTLPPDEASRLVPLLTAVSLGAGEDLARAFVYFPTSGSISTLGLTEDGATVEVALAGRWGVAGVLDAIGNRPSPLRLQAQVAGAAFRIDARLLRRQLQLCGALLDAVHAHVQATAIQMSQTAICNRFHTTEQRLSRWLLVAAAVSGEQTFTVTQEALSQLVGGPRSAVSRAATQLREAGLITCSRGRFAIRNPSRLERVSCECYHVLQLMLTS
ncbi:MAG: Crp/Fnr family transcriptional regulator [Vicinamibacterales bacterium]